MRRGPTNPAEMPVDSGARRREIPCRGGISRGMIFLGWENEVSTVQNDLFGKTAEYWHVRSQETRSRAEQMITPETRSLMFGLADDYERTAHIVEGMASIHGALG